MVQRFRWDFTTPVDNLEPEPVPDVAEPAPALDPAPAPALIPAPAPPTPALFNHVEEHLEMLTSPLSCTFSDIEDAQSFDDLWLEEPEGQYDEYLDPHDDPGLVTFAEDGTVIFLVNQPGPSHRSPSVRKEDTPKNELESDSSQSSRGTMPEAETPRDQSPVSSRMPDVLFPSFVSPFADDSAEAGTNDLPDTIEPKAKDVLRDQQFPVGFNTLPDLSTPSKMRGTPAYGEPSHAPSQAPQALASGPREKRKRDTDDEENEESVGSSKKKRAT